MKKGMFSVMVFGIFLLGALPVFAQEDSSLRLVTSPLPINLSTKPGTEVSTAIKIKNDGARTENIKISVLKFKAYEETGKPQLLDAEEGDAFLRWVSFSEDPFTVEPQEWKTITATWKVPEDAALSYYYAIFFSRAGAEASAGERQTAIQGGSAILALLEAEVPGAERKVSVAEFSTDRKWYEFLPAKFTVKIRNEGNVHTAPRGNIFIGKGDEKEIALLEVNPTRGNILPESNRLFEESWADGFPVYQEKIENGKSMLDEKGNHIYELKWNWEDASNIRFGKYTGKLLLVYDDGTRDIPIEGEVSFWVVPWRLIGVALVVILFVFVGIKNTLQNFWKKMRNIFSKK